uniref:Uncharacterized protein n=1 Tax=Anguilla anguilla TaxID=7936 RepID=A0A0E9UM95_ANGAN
MALLPWFDLSNMHSLVTCIQLITLSSTNTGRTVL